MFPHRLQKLLIPLLVLWLWESLLLLTAVPALVAGENGKVRTRRFRDLPLDVVADLAEADFPRAGRIRVAEFEKVDVARVYGEAEHVAACEGSLLDGVECAHEREGKE